MPLSAQGKRYYTKEQLLEARECSALEYARSRGYDLVPTGQRRYTLREHDSMVFLADGRWYWNSRQVSGRALDLMIEYEGASLLDAVLTLTNDPAYIGSRRAVNYHSAPIPPAAPKVFKAPEKAKDNRRLFAYLIKTRGLDPDILRELVREGRVYQGVNIINGRAVYNAVFLGFDDQGIPRSAFQRSMTEQSKFKNHVEGSDKSWPFIVPGHPGATTLALFEAAIDAISQATIVKADGGDYKESVRLSVGGNFAMETVTRYLDVHPEITTIALGFDSDTGGRSMRDYLAAGLAGRQLRYLDLVAPQGKDWNEYLTGYYLKSPGKRPIVEVIDGAQRDFAARSAQKTDIGLRRDAPQRDSR